MHGEDFKDRLKRGDDDDDDDDDLVVFVFVVVVDVDVDVDCDDEWLKGKQLCGDSDFSMQLFGYECEYLVTYNL